MRKLLLLAALLVGLAKPAQGQYLDPDYCWTCLDSRHHAYAGAILDVVVRAPFVADSWNNRAWKRVLLVCGTGAVYEGMQAYEAKQTGRLGQVGYGFSPKDLAMDCGGAVGAELVIAGLRKVF